MRAGGGLRDVELHGARDDAVHLAAEDPGVVAEEAVERVEDGRVAAELHVLGRAVEAELARRRDRRDRPRRERPLCSRRGASRRSALSARFAASFAGARDLVLAVRADERVLDPLVDRADEERVEAAARVDLELPADDLAVARELLVHRDRVAPVVLADREEDDVERPPP